MHNLERVYEHRGAEDGEEGEGWEGGAAEVLLLPLGLFVGRLKTHRMLSVPKSMPMLAGGVSAGVPGARRAASKISPSATARPMASRGCASESLQVTSPDAQMIQISPLDRTRRTQDHKFMHEDFSSVHNDQHESILPA